MRVSRLCWSHRPAVKPSIWRIVSPQQNFSSPLGRAVTILFMSFSYFKKDSKLELIFHEKKLNWGNEVK